MCEHDTFFSSSHISTISAFITGCCERTRTAGLRGGLSTSVQTERGARLVCREGGATADTRCFLAIKGAKSLSVSLVVSQAIFIAPRDERRPTTVAVAGASGRWYS